MTQQLTARITPWMDAAIEKHAQGEKVLWETSLIPVQTAEGPIPALHVFVWYPGAILGDVIHGSFRVDNPMGFTEESVEETMTEFLRQMREARSQQLANHQKNLADQVKQGRSESGLLLPGS